MQRDAPPHRAFFGRRHLRPILDLRKRSTATLAIVIPLAGGADSDTRRIGRGVEPSLPRGIGIERHAGIVSLDLVVINQKRVDLSQHPYLGAKRHAIR